MHEFLKSIADGYVLAEGMVLDEYTFVFPNARSARFFREYLGSRLTFERGRLKTMCITLTEMVEKGCGRRRASGERLLFMLYRAYVNVRRALGSEADIRSFDRFRFWGEMILRDFTDVDKYMANADEVFRNIRDYKQIQTFYLTDEQKEIIREYWGEDPYWQPVWEKKSDADELPFWNHVNGASDAERRFTQLWQLLGPLYREFRRLLDLSGECYPGMAYRIVADTLLSGGRLRFNPRRYVFIGFNRLSTAEHIIFEQLDRRGLAHFYWDYDPVLMNPATGNKAGRFISKYAAAFSSSLPEVKLPPRGGSHKVDVIGVPSNVGQAKVAATLLSEPGTAIVLASDDLLLPMAQSVPERFDKVNVTMGYPLRYSALAQLFSQLIGLQLRARPAADGGDMLFFRDDVMALLSSPLVQAVFPDECRGAVELMRERHLFNLPSSLVESEAVFEPLRPLLRPVGPEADMESVTAYVISVLAFVTDCDVVNGLDRKCASTIAGMVEQLGDLALEFNVEMQARTFFQFLERTVFQRSVVLEGRSFEAMQIMGVLETRCLGFDHVVMLSMTDAIYPGRSHGRSFIPENLRRAYGLPTRDHDEAEAAYHFYRLLSSSRHLTLLYDSRTGGLRSGEMSRFIFQLRYIDFPGVKLEMKQAAFAAASPREQNPVIGPKVEVTKTPEVMERINRYRDPKLCRKYNLSASSLKKYLNCPLAFYFERVQDIRPPEDEKEDVDAGVFGNTVHEVAETLYAELAERNDGVITAQMLEELMAGGFDDMLRRHVERSLRLHIDRLPRTVEDVDGSRMANPELWSAPLSPKADFHVVPITKYLCRMFRAERTPFTFRAAELSETFVWKNVAPGVNVNFTMKIDRLDSVTEADGSEVTRVVDYKTGSDSTEFGTVEQLLVKCDPNLPRAVFQLLTYCAAYVDFNAGRVDSSLLRPQIFTLRKIESGGFPLIKMSAGNGKVNLTSFAQVETEFRDELGKMLSELFDPSVPFTRAADERCCRFCGFHHLCYAQSRD